MPSPDAPKGHRFVRRTLRKRGLVSVLVAAVAATLLLAVVPAGASPEDPINLDLLDKGTPSTADDTVIAAAGSDTLEFVTDSIIATWDPQIKDHVYSIPPGPHLPAGDYTVPADADCLVPLVYNKTEPTTEANADGNGNGKLFPPNGSGAGRSALNTSASTATNYGGTINAENATHNGCVDVARSSGGPTGTDPAEFEYYGFALDAVMWGTTSTKAPSTLTLTQLRSVFRCEDETTAGLNAAQQAVDADTRVNNWAEVGGAFGRISRVVPQSDSGTKAFFVANVLGGTDPAGITNAACPNTLEVQENTGKVLTQGANEGRYDEYILPYSAGKWVFHVTNKGNPTVDLRNGVRPGAIARSASEVCPSPTSTPAFPVTFTGSNNNGTAAVRYDGSGWLLNATSLVCFNTVTATTSAGSTSITGAPAGTFTTSTIGLVVEGTGIFDGSVITNVGGGGTSATLSNSATASGTVSVKFGIPVVSEFNPNIVSATNVSIYPGVRELFHIVDTRSSSYDEALALFGFEAGTANKSPLCNGGNVGEILDNGFLDLVALTNNGTAGTTCRLQ